LSLKRREAWWCEVTLEQLFAERETLAWTDLWKSACLPVMLDSKDEVVFRLVD
jgi:hypothetical protein